ncbi:putative vacuolar h+\ ca2+ exchanger [Diplodia seriata]|uniref:Putative vacuolar h+\ ca2+ exchanger n=1 Tax=Diplodia seriata TaxID=420778 RepID=A0A0G2DXD2_9PEZI|nr:putative vacuolar h+\ ca2+ exchanger [Diplodia seriata]
MVPAANLIGFGGEQIVRKVYNVVGLIMETTLGSIVEMVVFTILITRTATDTFDPIQIIQAAILGSVLANLLFCIGLCFFIGGMKREEQQFHAAIGEVGGGLILVAGMALILPSAYINTLQDTEYGGTGDFDVDGLKISRGTAFILLASYMVYLWYQTNSHRSLYSDVFNHDLIVGDNHDKAVEEDKLSLSECILALVISVTCVCCIAYLLVDQIHFIVEERHVKDAFVGLILFTIPNHVVSGGNAARAQQELGFTFVALREVEEWLFTKPAADEYPRRISQLLNAAKASGSSWVSHWNPHKLDGGDMFSPLPAWPHQESKPTAARRKAPGSSSSSTRFPCTSTASSSTRRPPPNPNAGTSNRTSTGTGTSTNNPAADHPTPPPRIDPTTYLDPTNPLRGSHLTPAPPTTHTLLTTALATLPLPRALSHFPPFSGTPHSPDSTPHLLRHLAHPFSPARPLSIGIAIATVALSWPSWDRLTTHTAVAEAVVEVPTWIRGMAGDESVVTGLPVALVLKAEDGRAVEEGEGGER